MAITPPSTQERDANLDALKDAATEWFDKEQKRLDNETKFLRSVLQGRGLQETGTKNLEAVAAVVVEEINSFLLPTEK
jgi:hypothetical protein